MRPRRQQVAEEGVVVRVGDDRELVVGQAGEERAERFLGANARELFVGPLADIVGRRVCLFASYVPAGRFSDAALHYMRALKRC